MKETEWLVKLRMMSVLTRSDHSGVMTVVFVLLFEVWMCVPWT